MTIEKKHLMTLDDVRSLVFRCKCGSLMTVPIDDKGIKSLPQTCIHCKEDILRNHHTTEETIRKFVLGMRSIMDQTRDAGFKLELEIADYDS